VSIGAGCLSPDGNNLALGTQNGSVVIVANLLKSTNSPIIIAPLQIGNKHDWVESIIWFEYQNKSILACSISKDLYIYQIEGDECKATLLRKYQKHSASIQSKLIRQSIILRFFKLIFFCFFKKRFDMGYNSKTIDFSFEFTNSIMEFFEWNS